MDAERKGMILLVGLTLALGGGLSSCLKLEIAPGDTSASGKAGLTAVALEIVALNLSGNPVGVAGRPVLFPPAGTYNGGYILSCNVQFSLLSASPGATIYYTTDGSQPTTSSKSMASGGTDSGGVGNGFEVRAFARAPGLADSPAISGVYDLGAGCG